MEYLDGLLVTMVTMYAESYGGAIWWILYFIVWWCNMADSLFYGVVDISLLYGVVDYSLFYGVVDYSLFYEFWPGHTISAQSRWIRTHS